MRNDIAAHRTESGNPVHPYELDNRIKVTTELEMFEYDKDVEADGVGDGKRSETLHGDDGGNENGYKEWSEDGRTPGIAR